MVILDGIATVGVLLGNSLEDRAMLNILLVNENTGHEIQTAIEIGNDEPYTVFVKKLKEKVGKKIFYTYDIFETW